MAEQAPPPIEESRYGGFTRFELELEVRKSPLLVHNNLTNRTVCSMPSKPVVHEPPRHGKDARDPRVCRVPGLPAVLQRAKVCKVSDVSCLSPRDCEML